MQWPIQSIRKVFQSPRLSGGKAAVIIENDWSYAFIAITKKLNEGSKLVNNRLEFIIYTEKTLQPSKLW